MGGIGGLHSVAGLGSSWDDVWVVGQLTGLQCCGGWVQALQEEPAGQQGGKSPFMWESSETAMELCCRTTWGSMNQADQCGKSCCSCLLKATSWGKIWGLPHNWKVLCIHRPWSSWETSTSEETLICWRDRSARCKQLGGFWARWSRSWQGGAVLHMYRHGRCKGQGQPFLQWLQGGWIQDPERMELSK